MNDIGDIEDLRKTVFGTKHLQHSKLMEINDPAYRAFTIALAREILEHEKIIDFTNPKNVDKIMMHFQKSISLLSAPAFCCKLLSWLYERCY